MTRHAILDIETDGLDVSTNKVKVVGILDVETDKYYCLKWRDPDTILDILKDYEWIITFNGKAFDLPVLERHGAQIYLKHFDVYQVFKKRGMLLRYGGFKSYSMRNLAKELFPGEEGKGDIDYKIFQKDSWTPEEQKSISYYLKQDLITTKKLWQYLMTTFDPLKEYLPEEEVRKYNHVRTSSGSYVYKVFCHLAGMEEEYDDVTEAVTYPGAYVSEPTKETSRGDIFCFDFTSLYPSMIVQANLQSWNCTCCEPHERWSGGGHFEMNGSYCAKKQGKKETIVKQLFGKRKEYKKTGDSRQYAVKIILNTFYGASGNPVFKNLYHRDSAADTTLLGKQCALYARKRFAEHGYVVLYTDTDSVYVQDTMARGVDYAKSVASTINTELRSFFPFPWDEFGLVFESEIRYLQFFSDGITPSLKKKHYLYVTAENKLVVKGLPVLKRDCSKVGQMVFERLKPLIVDRLDCKFDEEFIQDIIKEIVAVDPTLIAKRFEVKDADAYKSASSLQSQIAAEFGPGEHYLVKNHTMGAGKNVKYCRVQDMDKVELDMEFLKHELGAFIK